MTSKVTLAYVVSDFLFLVTGIVTLAFSVLVQNFRFEIPTDGKQAARNLMYQRFPLTGECGGFERGGGYCDADENLQLVLPTPSSSSSHFL